MTITLIKYAEPQITNKNEFRKNMQFFISINFIYLSMIRIYTNTINKKV